MTWCSRNYSMSWDYCLLLRYIFYRKKSLIKKKEKGSYYSNKMNHPHSFEYLATSISVCYYSCKSWTKLGCYCPFRDLAVLWIACASTKFHLFHAFVCQTIPFKRDTFEKKVKWYMVLTLVAALVIGRSLRSRYCFKLFALLILGLIASEFSIGGNVEWLLLWWCGWNGVLM